MSMVAYIPQNLSPDLSSIVCPDIPGSFQFSWKFIPLYPYITGDKQTKAVIDIYEAGGTTALKTITVDGNDSIYKLASDTITWNKDTAYEWTVTTYNIKNAPMKSHRAKFYYAESPKVDDIIWSSGPAAYEYMGAREYFNTIGLNLLKLMADYVVDSTEEQSLYSKIQDNLFTGDIVPSRADFLLLEQAITFLYDKELVKGPDVDKMIEDGLGANDIHKVYELLSGTNGLTTMAPQPPTSVEITVNTIAVPKITSASFVSSGKEDNTVDVTWVAEGITETNGVFSQSITDTGGTIVIDGFSPSEDIWYYRCEYKYGNTSSPYSSILYYRPSDFDRINNTISFMTRYPEMFTSTTMKNIHHAFYIRAVDKRGNASHDFSKITKVGVDFKTPLGLADFEVQYQKLALTATAYTANGTWNALWKDDWALTTTHTLAKNQEGVYFYRVRYIDLSGQISDWVYTLGNKFDPLDPPKAPVPYPQNVKQDYFEIAWNAVPTAEYYEIIPTWWYPVPDPIRINETTTYWQGAPADTNFRQQVRAVNRAGVSPWAETTAHTLPRPILSQNVWVSGADVWRTGYTLGAGHSWNAAGWRTESWDSARNEMIQGMWIELRDGKNTDGIWVRKGTTYGNHKSIMYLDKGYWQNLLAGKEILKVEWFLERLNTSHGYPNDGRYIQVWTHDYQSRPSGEPWLGNGTKIWDVNFGRGDGKWVTLPTYYGELLRDGKIGGFALHADFRTSDTDQYTYCRFKEATTVRITFR